MKAKRNMKRKRRKTAREQKGRKLGTFFGFCCFVSFDYSCGWFFELLVFRRVYCRKKGRKRFIKVELQADGATRRSLV